MVKKGFRENLTTGQLNKIVAAAFSLFLLGGGILYWQQEISFLGFAFFAFFALVAGGLLVFDNRVAQKDGFLDGFRDGVDKIEAKK